MTAPPSNPLIMIFHHHKTVFFHLGKTAGTSMEDWLWPERPQDSAGWRDTLWGYDHDHGLWLQHVTPDQAEEILEVPWHRRYFTFTVVRDPFSRFLSAYRYARHDEGGGWGSAGDMEHFLAALARDQAEGRRFHNSHFWPQTDYLFLDGKPAMDHVGRYEDIRKTVRFLSKRLGIRRRFPKVNVSDTPITQNALRGLTPRAVDLIVELYGDDFKLLGYSRKPGGRRSLWFRPPLLRRKESVRTW